jgi:membrane protein YqaA with SNARE-associated domain
VALSFAVAITVLIFVYRDRLAEFSSYGYLGLFVVSVVGNATILLPAPSLAATFLAGGIFNPLLAGVVSGAGMAIGELSGYMAGYGGTVILDPTERARFERLQDWMRRHGFLTIFVLAVIPNPIFDLAGVAAGVLHFPLPHFLLACFLGKTVKGLAFALAGAQSLPWIEQFLR